MRLAVFTNQFPGPVSTFFARDIRGLIDAGIDVDVFPIYPQDETLWQYVPDILNQEVLPRNRVHHLALSSCLSNAGLAHFKKVGLFLHDSLLIGASALRYGMEPLVKSSYVALKAWIWANQYGTLFDHVFAYWGNYAATCAYLFHRLAAREIPFSIFLHAGTDLYRTPVFMRRKLLYADNVVTCSDFNGHFLRTQYRDIASTLNRKIHVHHHGLDLIEYSFNPNARCPNKIVGVGRLEKEKGFEYLIKAVHRLNCSGKGVTLQLVGDGSERNRLEALADELGERDSVTFTGWLTPGEAKRLISEAVVLVHPSPDLGDGVPNVIKESMALGTPVIASRVAGIPELLAHGRHGVLVPPRNVEALVDAIVMLLVDAEAQSRYRMCARQHVETSYDLWSNGRKLAKLLCSTEPQRV